MTFRYFNLACCMMLGVVLVGCGERSLNTSASNWIPPVTGGPLDVRTLPPAALVISSYKNLRDADTTKKVRLYKAVLVGATNQTDYSVSIRKGETPGGATYFTEVRFIYNDPTNGSYQLEWLLPGKLKTDFLKLTAQPKECLLQPFDIVNQTGIPRLVIMAWESVEPWQMLVAVPGNKPK